MKEEVIETTEATVTFREPTEEQLPTQIVPMDQIGYIGQNFFSDDDEWHSTVIGETPGGAQLQITKCPDTVGYEMSWRHGGEMPAALKGWYTSYSKAEVAARTYLHQLWAEARKDK